MLIYISTRNTVTQTASKGKKRRAEKSYGEMSNKESSERNAHDQLNMNEIMNKLHRCAQNRK